MMRKEKRILNFILSVNVAATLLAVVLSLPRTPIEITLPENTIDFKNVEERQNDPECICGRGGRKRIVGGTEAEMNAYPWLATIFWTSGDLLCSGAVINSRYVLSASHCFINVNAEDLSVHLGEYNFDVQNDVPSEDFRVLRIIMNENFGVASAVDSDIALLKLNRLIPYRDNIRPVCLTPPNIDYIGQMATVSGWGRTSFGGNESPILLEVKLPVISDDICRANFSARQYTANMLCAGYLDGGKDACQGDSGGPLFLQDDDGVFNVIGITSFGRGCATPGYPGVYTKMEKFLSWVQQKTSDVPQCSRPTTPTVSPPASCGIANSPRTKRIVGGLNSYPNHYPWTAIIIRKTSNGMTLQCGASLISDEWLITTARCVNDYIKQVYTLSVILGEYNVRRIDGTEIQRFLSEIHIHPDFSPSVTYTDDIALLRLNTPITFTREISPICLPPESWSNSNLAGITGVTSGWGWIDREGNFATVEQEVFLNITTLRECRRFYGPNVNSNFLCAISTDPNKGVCYFDFGGQLSVNDGDGNYVLIAMSSFVADVGCGLGRPSGFIKVLPYLQWISNKTGISS